MEEEIIDKLKEDALNYGNALNEAGWAFIDAHAALKLGNIRGHLFNNLKSLLRSSIIVYLEALKKEDDYE